MSRFEDPVIISNSISGAIANRDQCPAIPYSPEEYAAEAQTYFAYAGTFEVNEAAGTVTHHMAVSLFPGWVGDGQVRVVELDGDRLVLRSAAPLMSGGRLVTMRLSWERARS